MIKIFKININEIPLNEFYEEYNFLSEEGKKLLNKYKSDDDKKRSLAGKILLRRALKERYDISLYDLDYTERGKPILPFCNFSISHSGEYAVCVVSDKPIGIDIEKIRDIKSSLKYHFFNTDEASFVNESTDINEAFLKIWTRKEALYKSGNIDLKDLSSFCVLNENSDYSFKTKKFNNYIISVCLKS